MSSTSVRHSCPVDECSWNFDEPYPVFVPEGGPYRTVESFTEAMNRQHSARTESEVAEHFARHSPSDYLRTIRRLQAELAIARGVRDISESALVDGRERGAA